MSRLPFWLQLLAVVAGTIAISLVVILSVRSHEPGRLIDAPAPISRPTVAQPVAPAAPPPVSVAAQTPVAAAPPTSLPTPAPAVKPEPKPSGPSPDVRAYLEWARPQILVAQRAMAGLGEQFTAAGQNPRLIADTAWRIKTATALAFMKTTGESLQKYPGSVTPELQTLDGIMKGLGGDFVYVADETIAGLDQGNVTRINNATARMNAATQKMKDGTAEVERLSRAGA